MNWNKLLLLIFFNVIFLQGNYQLLSVPHNFQDMFKGNQIIDNKNISFFHLIYPNKISLSSISFPLKSVQQKKSTELLLSKYYIDFSYLNYGQLIDSESNYSFYPDEALIQINRLKKYSNNVDILFSAGYMISSLDIYSSSAIITNIFLSFKDFKKEVFFGLKNFGYVIDSYTNYDMDLPSLFHLTFLKKFKPIEVQLNYEKRLDINESTIAISSKLFFNEKLEFYLSSNSNRNDLLYGDYIDKIAVGTSFGLSYNNENNIISIGVQNLGAAGYATSIFFEKIKL